VLLIDPSTRIVTHTRSSAAGVITHSRGTPARVVAHSRSTAAGIAVRSWGAATGVGHDYVLRGGASSVSVGRGGTGRRVLTF
jgi:hypothetical protein